MLPHIWGLFTQVDSSLERKHSGLGIGLTLVKNLVELHGGRVEAQSDGPGLGSEFIVRLPLSAALPGDGQPASTPAPSRAAGSLSGRSILVVDDMVDSARSLARLLQLLGNDVQVAHDGPGALAAAAAHRPKVVILDIGLPGLNGFEVARRLRKDVGLTDAFVIALTGYGTENDHQLALKSGCDAHLIKPIDFDALQDLLAAR